MTSLGRDALKKRQKWYAGQGQFYCAEGIDVFAGLAPDDLFDAVLRERDCEGFQWPRASAGHSLPGEGGIVRLPTWQVSLIVVAAVAACIAATAALVLVFQ